jgi:5,6,7,8-tetrahydromethanopterin hydro-lyase
MMRAVYTRKNRPPTSETGRVAKLHMRHVLHQGDSRNMANDHTMHIGEALVGEGNEIAHIDLLIGTKDGPVGHAFANALANQSAGHSNLLAVLTPNLMCKPATVLITKVTIKGAKQAVLMFGPAQYAVAKAVADCVADGTIPAAEADNLVIVCGVFIHWDAEDHAKIIKYNYEATKLSIQRAMKNQPTPAEVVAGKDSAKHPFA